VLLFGQDITVARSLNVVQPQMKVIFWSDAGWARDDGLIAQQRDHMPGPSLVHRVAQAR
jgi:hypothetical protein